MPVITDSQITTSSWQVELLVRGWLCLIAAARGAHSPVLAALCHLFRLLLATISDNVLVLLYATRADRFSGFVQKLCLTHVGPADRDEHVILEYIRCEVVVVVATTRIQPGTYKMNLNLVPVAKVPL